MSHPNTVPMEALASIHGLFLPDGLLTGNVLLELEPGLQIVQLDAETERLMYQTETIRRVGRLRLTDRFFAVRVEYNAEGEDDLVRTGRDEANGVLRAVLDCLRLHGGRLYYGGAIHRAIGQNSWTELFHWPWPTDPGSVFPIHSKSEIQALKDLWALVRSSPVQARPHVGVAIRWFSGSEEVPRLEDRVLSLMVSAEALFQASSNHSKAAHIRVAARQLGLPSVNGEDPAEHLGKCYSLRNTIVHEGRAEAWRYKGKPSLSRRELMDFVSTATVHLRNAIRKVMEGIAASAP